VNIKQLKHWVETNLNVVEFMLWNFRKKNIELNDEYNKLIDEKTRLKVEYLEIKKQLEDYEEKKTWKSWTICITWRVYWISTQHFECEWFNRDFKFHHVEEVTRLINLYRWKRFKHWRLIVDHEK
jgi:predicted nuclease with TOPRIM domain